MEKREEIREDRREEQSRANKKRDGVEEERKDEEKREK